jgi:hypothetical protein
VPLAEYALAETEPNEAVALEMSEARSDPGHSPTGR